MKRKQKPIYNQAKLALLSQAMTPTDVHEMLLSRCRNSALELASELMQQEVSKLCGANHERKNDELHWRGGSEPMNLVLNGAKYKTKRPRVRSGSGEVGLEIVDKLRNQDVLDQQMLNSMIHGVSTRNYDQVINGFADRTGTSKSSVSRAFSRASQKDLDELNSSDLSKYSFIGLMIDGVEFAGSTVVVAMGITHDCRKEPVGLIEGDTENHVIVKALLSNLLERGFKLHCAKLLAVLDGSKALRKAVLKVFGGRVIIARCWIHKLRNLWKYLPEEHHATAKWRMKKLMGLARYEDAKKELVSFKAWLSTISHDATRSLVEAGEDLITVIKLGIPPLLRKTLSSTNAIESLLSIVRDHTDRVKNWKSDKNRTQVKRWIASTIQARRKRLNRLHGYKEVQSLIDALGGVAKQESLA